MTAVSVAATPSGPLDPRQRLEIVDMVRGFALFGVLLVNMMNFGALASIWTGPLDELVSWGQRFFFEMKSWSLFSFLFGFGFALQMLRAEARGVRLVPFYLRRLGVLFIIGAAHSLFYLGDILMTYAQLGLFLMLLRHSAPRTLLTIAAVLFLLHPIDRAVESTIAQMRPQDSETSTVTPTDANEETRRTTADRLRPFTLDPHPTHPYAVGSFGEVMMYNARWIPRGQLPTVSRLRGAEAMPTFFAMFVLGLYVGRRRILHDVAQHRTLIRRVLWWGLLLGLTGMTVDWVLRDVWMDPPLPVLTQLVGDLLWAYGTTALSFAYAAAIVLLAQRAPWRRVLSPLGALGRMALSTYLLQTLMFTTLFYGYGFGQYFEVGPAGVFGYTVLFFAVQIVASVWWLRHFQFGPAEWLWRTLTYLKPPIRI